MQIIKINQNSFKVLLTKEDLAFGGIENLLSDKDKTGLFFAKIIERAGELYGTDFDRAQLDAEFFESKCGGGELFVCKKSDCQNKCTYLFTAPCLETLICLCKRLLKGSKRIESRLCHSGKRYSLILSIQEGDEFTMAIIKEYGEFCKISTLQRWLLEEHEKIIIERGAIEELTERFR